jgi:hypothetical protein
MWSPNSPGWQSGASVRAWTPPEFSSRASDDALRALRDTGTTTAVLIVPWYMATATSTALTRGAETPTDSSLRHGIAQARRLGMRVVLKLHIDVVDGCFRGAIAPASVDQWFTSYRRFLEHYTELARQARVSALVIGTELTSMSRYTPRWRRLVAGARVRFPGQLTFAANQIEGAESVRFWDALDYLGIDAYMPLATNEDVSPSVDQLVSAWTSFTHKGTRRHYYHEIASLHERTGKPVLFTELGYRSALGCAIEPWDWQSTRAAAQEEQAHAYEAAYRVWSGVPWLDGIYWWDWHAGEYDPADSGYNPRGKLAEAVMHAWSQAGRGPA